MFGDEPTGNLDSVSSREVLALMRTAVDDLGQTIVMVTHDPAAAATADRVVFLADGRVSATREAPTIDVILDELRALAMTALALRSLAERKLRSALTAVAIMLGVAMIAGTYVQTDQIRTAFTDIEQAINEGVDVDITPKAAFTTASRPKRCSRSASSPGRRPSPASSAPRASSSSRDRSSSAARRSSRRWRRRSSCRSCTSRSTRWSSSPGAARAPAARSSSTPSSPPTRA